MKVVALAAAFVVLPVIFGLQAQDNRSLKDFEYAQLGQEISVPGSDDMNAGDLEERLVLAQASIKALTEALGISNSEAEIFKRQVEDLHVKLDAYGLSGLEKDPGKLEQRLLAAVRDLRILKKQKEEVAEVLIRLSESIQLLLKKSEGIDPEERVTVETELRKTNEVLGSPQAIKAESLEATLSDGLIIDCRDDLSLVVANIGDKNGVKIGMPFQIWRDSRRIGSATVVDVRSHICGAIIQNLESEKESVKIGDRLSVDTKK